MKVPPDDELVEEELQVLCRAKAICEYVPEEMAQEGEITFLSFIPGEIIDVLEQVFLFLSSFLLLSFFFLSLINIFLPKKKDESGWWEGVLHGMIGVFPGSYTQVIEWYSNEEEETPKPAKVENETIQNETQNETPNEIQNQVEGTIQKSEVFWELFIFFSWKKFIF